MTGKRGAPPRAVVILGEDDNDRQAIKILVAALRPDLGTGIQTLRKPMALVKNVPPERLPSKAQRDGALLRAVHARKPIRCVFMHEDADAVEPAHERLITKIEECYSDLPWPVHAVVPAWETETWWFLFPKALKAVRPSWRMPTEYAGRDLGRIRNSKEELKKALLPAGSKPATLRTYAEADSALIAEKIVALKLLAPPWFAKSASWLAFVKKVTEA
ncbi:hypothetical protein GCM10022225_05080 [Plantactinospora mayteni]|uniref:DUF4276 family protein n=1 Tax=Plantactinospora mayteni TaxID=566021 RepID=A0ABQ4EQP8_9ACTN|nr:hypothetical protein [Plantactinospora mayteni]GIG96997.1 hypothetical protein Pma05_35700 [Plantactinospora mayteni]